MRSVIAALVVAAAALSSAAEPVRAQSAQTLFEQITSYRFFTSRRHNDIQGVESVFDDYRKNWLRRTNSGVLVGTDGLNPQSDTPVCSKSDAGSVGAGAASLCGNGHVLRGGTTFIGAKDTRIGADIREVGNLTYLGYEYLFSNDMFLGVGLSGAGSEIRNRAGQGVKVEVAEIASHLIGGYRVNNNNMIAWNITYAQSAQWTQRGGVTGRFGMDALFANGVWYTNVMLTDTAYVSLGLDYTLEIAHGGRFTESDGTRHLGLNRTVKQWQGDFTPSALFVQPLQGGEVFARIGANIDTLNTRNDRFVDVPIDVGGAYRLNRNLALTASVGATLVRPDYTEFRAMFRLTGRP